MKHTTPKSKTVLYNYTNRSLVDDDFRGDIKIQNTKYLDEASSKRRKKKFAFAYNTRTTLK